jgi:hypothetical protein
MRLKQANLEAALYLAILDESGTVLSFDDDECYALTNWPSSDVTFYVASTYARRTDLFEKPQQLDVNLELVHSNGTVVASDKIKLTVAPLILPPECNPTEAVYATGSITNVLTLTPLVTTGDRWTQDQVKFAKAQCGGNVINDVYVTLDHPDDGNLRDALAAKSLYGVEWPNGGQGGSMMARRRCRMHPMARSLLVRAVQWRKAGGRSRTFSRWCRS